MTDFYDYIGALGQKLHRPLKTLIACDSNTDPFNAGRESRRAGAEWFADLWKRFDFQKGTHIRRIHYQLISQEHATAIKCLDGSPYINTTICYTKLGDASRDARYLDLVPVDHFVDRRNDDACEYLFASAKSADVSISDADQISSDLQFWGTTSLGGLPAFAFDPPIVDQRYHVEIWIEKSTMSDIVMPLARTYGLNVVSAVGEISITHCYNLVERAVASGRPVRILYISDFDPGGQSMPVACARKIEFFLRRDNLNLDIQVRPVALSHDQCVQYELPRTPIKKSETRRHGFEKRFGEGGTELDALEALRPGELHLLLEREIRRYFDPGLRRRVNKAAGNFEAELRDIRDDVASDFAADLQALQKAHAQITRKIEAEVKAIKKRHGKAFKQIVARHNRIAAAIAQELNEQMPDPDSVAWPAPANGDEDADPLFDSTRDYVTQIDRFKRHQGKPITRKPSSEWNRKR